MDHYIEYKQCGDYLIPDLTIPEEEKQTFGKYGMLRKTCLKNHRRGTYSMLILSGSLNAHLHEIDEQANDFLDRYVKEAAKAQGVDEALKARDQMAWVGAINNIRAQAEEIIFAQIVYA